MQEFDKLVAAIMLTVAAGLILLALAMGFAAWRAHRNAQLALRQMIAILIALILLLIVPAILLLVYDPIPS